MNDRTLEENAGIVRAALVTEGKALAAIVLLLYALDTIHRIELEQPSDVDVLEVLRCLASVRAELMMALRVEAGVGPFDYFDAPGVVGWMLGPSTTACRESVEKVMDLAARDVTRLFGDA